MTLALAGACSPTDRVLIVDGATRRPMPFVAQVDSELVLVIAGAAPIDARPYPNPTTYRWQVERGLGGSGRDQHDAGAVVTEVNPVVQSDPITIPVPAGAGMTPETPVLVEPCRYTLWSDKRGVFQQLDDYTYDNGVLGVGSTMTADDVGPLFVGLKTLELTPAVGDRLAVADQYNTVWGVFVVTDPGSEDAPWILTRASDLDTKETFCRYWVCLVTDYDGSSSGLPALFRSTSVDPDDSLDSYSRDDLNCELMSLYAEARGKGSLAVGVEPVTLGYCSFAQGGTSTAVGAYAWAAHNSHAFGEHAYAHGDSSVAVGIHAEASADNATAIGNGTVADVPGVTFLDGPEGSRVILKAPGGDKFYITVGDDGTLDTVAVAP